MVSSLKDVYEKRWGYYRPWELSDLLEVDPGEFIISVGDGGPVCVEGKVKDIVRPSFELQIINIHVDRHAKSIETSKTTDRNWHVLFDITPGITATYNPKNDHDHPEDIERVLSLTNPEDRLEVKGIYEINSRNIIIHSVNNLTKDIVDGQFWVYRGGGICEG
jgi:hypothetical protein